MDVNSFLTWLQNRPKFAEKSGLSRMTRLLEALENPQNDITAVHIAGTNGKGSTTAFLRQLLQSQGLTVGTFTSPYIEVFNERISINGTPISNEELERLINRIVPIVEEIDELYKVDSPLEFEILTAMMFDYFKTKKIDIALIEVGIGGRYDSTNVLRAPLVSLITTIGLDHTGILGDTVEEIAYQKAGIIKQNCPVVIGDVSDSVFSVLKQEAVQCNSEVYRYHTDFETHLKKQNQEWGERFEFSHPKLRLRDLTISLMGEYQIDNAAVAIQAFSIIAEKMKLPVQLVDYKTALNETRWPGRMEKIFEEPLLILDGAHNEPAILKLSEFIQTKCKHRRVHIIFGAIETKDALKMLQPLKDLKNVKLRATQFDFPKSYSKQQYEAMGIKGYEKWESALYDVLSEIYDEDDMILMTGSLYFISEVRTHLLKEIKE